jgi:hypothetical protein
MSTSDNDVVTCQNSAETICTTDETLAIFIHVYAMLVSTVLECEIESFSFNFNTIRYKISLLSFVVSSTNHNLFFIDFFLDLRQVCMRLTILLHMPSLDLIPLLLWWLLQTTNIGS